MRTVRVEKTFAAPIDAVFDVISDHAGYARLRPVQRAWLLEEGADDPNGLGAVREIHVWPLRFVEEITRFERPTRMDYLIRAVNVPLAHDGGSMTLEATAAGTHLRWTSTFEFTVPGIGGALTAAAAPLTSAVFRFALNGFERLLSE